jgi:ribonuclease HI
LKKDAEDYLAGKVVASSKGKKKEKYYAVAVGNPTGVFRSWPEVQKAIAGVKGHRQKSFPTEKEALDYVYENGSDEARKALGDKAPKNEPQKPQQGINVFKDGIGSEKFSAKHEDPNTLRIWTDGSSRGNGQRGARAGLGVYFGPNDPRNLSQPLPGDLQTNQRAELLAIQRALESVPDTQDVEIVTDSQYSINCVTVWAAKWEKNQWKTSGDQPVKNKDIVQDVRKLMEKREGVTNFKWVKGHALDKGNEEADKLAVQGAMRG